MSGPSPLAVWLLAVRPRTLPAAAAPVVLATGMAAARGTMSALPALAALAGALLIQIATNLANDYFDGRSGVDSEARLGPVRVVQAGLLPAEAVLGAAIGTVAVAMGIGGYLVWVGGLPILLIGVASILCAFAYSGGPFPLSEHGLGDLFVFVFFGLIALGGSYWVQALALPLDVVWAGAGVGAVATAILVVNNLRDIETDARAGRRTLAVRLGPSGTRTEYLLLLTGAALVPLVGILAFGWSAWTLLGTAGLLPQARTAVTVFTYIDPKELNPALGATARGGAWYAGLMALGFLLGAPTG